MLLKNLLNQLKNQKLITILIIANAAIAAFAICFSYGIFQNYQTKINEGDQEGRTITIAALYSTADEHKYKDYNEKYDMTNEYSSITKGYLVKLLKSLSSETKEAIDCIGCDVNLENEIFDLCYFSFCFKINDKGIIPAYSSADIFTEDEYLKGEKVIAIGSDFYNEAFGSGRETLYYHSQKSITLSRDITEITIAGESYKILENKPNISYNIYIPFTAIDDDTPLKSLQQTVDITFTKDITFAQYTDVKSAVNIYLADKGQILNADKLETAEINFYKTIVGITLLISVLSAINLCVMFKYFIERERTRTVIFRVCGCSRLRSIGMFLLQAGVLILPVFAIAEVIFRYIIYPKLLPLYPFMEGTFSTKIYQIMFGAYSLMSLIILSIMLIFSIGKKVDFTEEKL